MKAFSSADYSFRCGSAGPLPSRASPCSPAAALRAPGPSRSPPSPARRRSPRSAPGRPRSPSLEELEVPDEVLRQQTLQLDIGVTHHKAPGAAWAQYTILVIYAMWDSPTT